MSKYPRSLTTRNNFLYTFLRMSFFLTLGHLRVNMNTLEITIPSSHTQRGSKYVLGSTAVNKSHFYLLRRYNFCFQRNCRYNVKSYQTTPAQSTESCRASHLVSLMKYRKFMRNHSIINKHIIKIALSYLLQQSRVKSSISSAGCMFHLTEKSTLDPHKALLYAFFWLAVRLQQHSRAFEQLVNQIKSSQAYLFIAFYNVAADMKKKTQNRKICVTSTNREDHPNKSNVNGICKSSSNINSLPMSQPTCQRWQRSKSHI